MNNTQVKAMLESYGRSFLGAALALYMTGSTDWQDYTYALVAAFAPVAIRYFNKNDISFGKINGNSTPDQIATEALSAIEAVVKKATKPVAKAPKSSAKVAEKRDATRAAGRSKAPAKKSTAKKTTSK